MHEELKKHLPYVQGIVDLFFPFVEGVIHDLQSGTIEAIFNNFSKRQLGEVTPLKELHVDINQLLPYFPPYYKFNWDGRKLKCISITIRNDQNQPIGLICFNFDISVFQKFEHKLSSLLQLKREAENPIELFGENWQGQIQNQINQYLSEKKLALHHLKRNEKKNLIQFLYSKGIFNFKNAAPYVSELLGISRASLYNYLKT